MFAIQKRLLILLLLEDIVDWVLFTKRTVCFIKGNLETCFIKTKYEVQLIFLKKITWKQRRDVLASEKGLQPIKINTPPVISHLSWHGTVCPRFCFCVQQQVFEYSGSYIAVASKVSSWTKSHVPNWFAEKGKKRKAACQSRLSCWQIFMLSSYQALKFADFNIGWCGNWSLTVRRCWTTST